MDKQQTWVFSQDVLDKALAAFGLRKAQDFSIHSDVGAAMLAAQEAGIREFLMSDEAAKLRVVAAALPPKAPVTVAR